MAGAGQQSVASGVSLHKENLADILTKALPRSEFEYLRDRLNVVRVVKE